MLARSRGDLNEPPLSHGKEEWFLATTTLLQRHAGEGETIAEAIRDCLDYGKDPEKPERGKYISVYECDPATVADEFLLAKASYVAMTGREQKKENDVLCYQIRQSFYPGEITPKEAHRTIVSSFLLIFLTQANVGDFSLADNAILPIVLMVLSLIFAFLSIYNVETKDLN